eukprot:jgi/Mesvir1/25505/Mv01758-RA.1
MVGPMQADGKTKGRLFEGLVVTATNLSKKLKRDIERAVTDGGGRFSGKLNRDCTHLLADIPWGLKFELARQRSESGQFNIWIVQSRWLLDCLDFQERLPEADYELRPAADSGTPQQPSPPVNKTTCEATYGTAHETVNVTASPSKPRPADGACQPSDGVPPPPLFANVRFYIDPACNDHDRAQSALLRGGAVECHSLVAGGSTHVVCSPRAARQLAPLAGEAVITPEWVLRSAQCGRRLRCLTFSADMARQLITQPPECSISTGPGQSMRGPHSPFAEEGENSVETSGARADTPMHSGPGHTDHHPPVTPQRHHGAHSRGALVPVDLNRHDHMPASACHAFDISDSDASNRHLAGTADAGHPDGRLGPRDLRSCQHTWVGENGSAKTVGPLAILGTLPVPDMPRSIWLHGTQTAQDGAYARRAVPWNQAESLVAADQARYSCYPHARGLTPAKLLSHVTWTVDAPVTCASLVVAVRAGEDEGKGGEHVGPLHPHTWGGHSGGCPKCRMRGGRARRVRQSAPADVTAVADASSGGGSDAIKGATLPALVGRTAVSLGGRVETTADDVEVVEDSEEEEECNGREGRDLSAALSRLSLLASRMRTQQREMQRKCGPGEVRAEARDGANEARRNASGGDALLRLRSSTPFDVVVGSGPAGPSLTRSMDGGIVRVAVGKKPGGDLGMEQEEEEDTGEHRCMCHSQHGRDGDGWQGGMGMQGGDGEDAVVLRPLTDGDLAHVELHRPFLTLLFPVDAYGEMGPCARTLHSATGFTCGQILQEVHRFYHARLSDEELALAMHLKSDIGQLLRSSLSEAPQRIPERHGAGAAATRREEANREGPDAWRRFHLLGRMKGFQGLQRVGQEYGGQLYEVLLIA